MSIVVHRTNILYCFRYKPQWVQLYVLLTNNAPFQCVIIDQFNEYV